MRHITQKMKKKNNCLIFKWAHSRPHYLLSFAWSAISTKLASPNIRSMKELGPNPCRISSFSQLATAEGLIIGNNTDHLNSGTLMKHRLFDYF
jgi:hypothetical protein